MKIVFRKFRWIFRKDWYSRARLKEDKIIDCGWFSLCFKKQKSVFNIVTYHIGNRIAFSERYFLTKEINQFIKNKILKVTDDVTKKQGVYGGWTHTAIRMALEEELE